MFILFYFDSSGDEMATTLVMRTVKNTERVYKNRTAMEVLALEAEFPGTLAI